MRPARPSIRSRWPGSSRTIDELRQDHAIVIVTHNLQQAARVFVAFKYLGELLEFGTVQDVFLQPKEPRTKRFIAGRFG